MRGWRMGQPDASAIMKALPQTTDLERPMSWALYDDGKIWTWIYAEEKNNGQTKINKGLHDIGKG